jgi:putative solute:sodium symporter small subunit
MPGNGSIDVHDRRIRAAIDSYWRQNLRIMAVLLAIWALVGLGCGVLFADTLSRFHLGGFPLGFWFAQQGSIVVFVLLILAYCVLLNRLDERHHSEIERIQRESQRP